MKLSLNVLNKAAITIYLAASPTLTGLVYEKVIDSGLALIIAGGITSIGVAWHLGQGAVTVGETKR